MIFCSMCKKPSIGNVYKNNLTAKTAKKLYKDRKELNYTVLTLRALRLLCELCG